MSWSVLAGLALCNVMWSATYSVSKKLMGAGYAPLEIAFLRFFCSAVPLWAAFLWGGRLSPFTHWWNNKSRVDVRLFAVGVLTFFVSPITQMVGLSLSRAIDGALMIALEPLVTIFAARVFLGEPIRRHQVVAVFLALLGVGILTELTWDKVSGSVDGRLLGNLIFMLSVVSECAYSVLAKPALDRRSPLTFLAVANLTGVVLLFALNIFLYGPQRMAGLTPLFARGDFFDWSAVLFLGVGCITFGYLYWMYVLRRTRVLALALTLYIQPVLGMVWGSIFVGEALSTSTLTGAALVFSAIWLAFRRA